MIPCMHLVAEWAPYSEAEPLSECYQTETLMVVVITRNLTIFIGSKLNIVFVYAYINIWINMGKQVKYYFRNVI